MGAKRPARACKISAERARLGCDHYSAGIFCAGSLLQCGTRSLYPPKPAAVRMLISPSLLLYLLCGIIAAAAHAQSPPPAEPQMVRFRVEVEAPRAYKRTLEQGLDLVRWQRDERVTMALLERLSAEARKAAAETLAADGYFSANVQSRIEAAPGAQVIVRIVVEPGPRTFVRAVDLGFEGPVTADPE